MRTDAEVVRRRRGYHVVVVHRGIDSSPKAENSCGSTEGQKPFAWGQHDWGQHDFWTISVCKIKCGASRVRGMSSASGVREGFAPEPDPDPSNLAIGCGANVSSDVAARGSAAWTFVMDGQVQVTEVTFATCDTTTDSVLVLDGVVHDDDDSCGSDGRNELVAVAVGGIRASKSKFNSTTARLKATFCCVLPVPFLRPRPQSFGHRRNWGIPSPRPRARMVSPPPIPSLAESRAHLVLFTSSFACVVCFGLPSCSADGWD